MNNRAEVEKLYKNFADRVFRYSMMKLGNKEEAEEVTAESFTRLLEGNNLKRVKDKESWIFGIARNIIYNKYREEKVQEMGRIDSVAEDSFPSSEDISKQVVTEELTNIIKKELGKLDERTQEVVTLKVWEELKFGEIAEIVGEEEGAVKMRYYRGVEKLKENIERKDKKTYVITLPLIIAGIGKMGKSKEYILSKSLMSTSMATAGTTTTLSTIAKILGVVILGGTVVAITTLVSFQLVDSLREKPVLDTLIENEIEEEVEESKSCIYKDTEYQEGEEVASGEKCTGCICEDGEMRCDIDTCGLAILDNTAIRYKKRGTNKEFQLVGWNGTPEVVRKYPGLLSPDKKYSVFLDEDSEYQGGVPRQFSTDPYSRLQGNNEFLYLYDLETKKIDRILKEETLGMCFVSGWSPLSQFVILDCGTSPTRGITVVDISSKRRVANVMSHTGGLVFNEDETKFVYAHVHRVYAEDDDFPVPKEVNNRPWDFGTATSIVNYDITSGVKKMLVQATKRKDYTLMGLMNDLASDEFRFRYKETFSENTWGPSYYDHLTYKYFSMDWDGQDKIRIEFPDEMEKTRETIVKYVKKKNEDYEVQKEVISHPIYDGWFVFALYSYEDRTYSVAIINVNDKKNTFKVLTGGDLLGWEVVEYV